MQCVFDKTPLKDITDYVSKVHQVPRETRCRRRWNLRAVTIKHDGTLKEMLDKVLPSLGHGIRGRREGNRDSQEEDREMRAYSEHASDWRDAPAAVNFLRCPPHPVVPVAPLFRHSKAGTAGVTHVGAQPAARGADAHCCGLNACRSVSGAGSSSGDRPAGRRSARWPRLSPPARAATSWRRPASRRCSASAIRRHA